MKAEKNFVNDWTKNIFSKKQNKEILVRFRNYSTLERYTMDIYGLLVTDKSVVEIIDSETGELIFERE